MYIRKFGLDPDRRLPQDRDWVGAEIRSCCRLAALLEVTLIEAASHIVPVAVTAGEAVERLRRWASGRCRAAERPGIYSRERNGMPSSVRGGTSTATTRPPTDKPFSGPHRNSRPGQRFAMHLPARDTHRP